MSCSGAYRACSDTICASGEPLAVVECHRPSENLQRLTALATESRILADFLRGSTGDPGEAAKRLGLFKLVNHPGDFAAGALVGLGMERCSCGVWDDAASLAVSDGNGNCCHPNGAGGGSHHSTEARARAALCGRLLALGGEKVCLPEIEGDLAEILGRGEAMSGCGVEMMAGDPSQCHANSAELYGLNREKVSLATGYALSSDGIWRAHTWLVQREGGIVETTEERDQYFGFVLTEEEAGDFVGLNLW